MDLIISKNKSLILSDRLLVGRSGRLLLGFGLNPQPPNFLHLPLQILHELLILLQNILSLIGYQLLLIL